jgi:RNA-directed DNA polymerase
MKESYGEGVATHTGPESCVGVREGVGEALTGVRAGQPLSREIRCFRGAHAVRFVEGNTEGAVKARRPSTPRGLRPCACTEALYTGSGRSHDRPGEDGCPVRAVNPTGERRR